MTIKIAAGGKEAAELHLRDHLGRHGVPEELHPRILKACYASGVLGEGAVSDDGKLNATTRLERVKAAMASRELAAVSRQIEGALGRLNLKVEDSMDLAKLNSSMSAAGMAAVDRINLKRMLATIGAID